jgi:DNA-binding phage protein
VVTAADRAAVVATALLAVEDAREALDSAAIARDVAIMSAVEAGCTVTAVADAAHLTRPTIYRIISDNGGGQLPPASEWGEHLDGALMVAAGHASSNAAGRALAVVASTSLDIRARRLRETVKAMVGKPSPGTADWDVLARGVEIAAHVDRKARRLGRGSR